METGKIEIIEFNDELSSRFMELNIAWLQKYFEVEPVDYKMLSDPREFIIDKGGYIFFAMVDEHVAGTFALLKEATAVYELSKMAVSEKFQGRKIGNAMLEFALTRARELRADKIILYSNTILEPAIHLYRKYGFKEVPITSSLYKRSNIKMEIQLKIEK